MFPRHHSRLGLIAAALVSCSAPELDLECVMRSAQPIVLGEGGESYDASRWAAHVVLLRIEVDQVVSYCSGGIVGAGVVLTAAHCFRNDDDLPLRAEVMLHEVGEECGEESESVPVLAHVTHAELDAALVYYEPVTPTFFPLLAAGLGVGAPVIIAGYGLDAQGRLGWFEAVAARVEEVGEDVISVRGENAGACLGDSGGPLVALDGSVPVLAGVLSTGAASCAGRDYYVSTHALKVWLSEHLPDATWLGSVSGM